MNQQQSVTFEMTADDHAVGAKLSLLRVLSRPFRPLTIIGIICVALYAVATVVGFLKSGELSLTPLIGISPLAAFGLLLYFVAAPHAARRNFKYNKMAHHPIALTWDDVAMDFRSHDSRSRIQWSDLYRTMENGKVMLFFPSPQLMHIVPKRFLTAAQIEQLRGYSGMK